MKHRNQKKKYFSLASAGRTADIFIFGDITSWEWLESDVSSYTLARAVQDLEADQINVHINSYGGEVAEGLAICNSLKNHPARVRTVCDGFACSAASVVFMAGDERVMNPASLLMVHNAWTNASGNARELRKAADDLDVSGNLQGQGKPLRRGASGTAGQRDLDHTGGRRGLGLRHGGPGGAPGGDRESVGPGGGIPGADRRRKAPCPSSASQAGEEKGPVHIFERPDQGREGVTI